MKKNHLNINIAAVIYALRKWKGLHQLYYANVLNIDRSTYGRMESGKAGIAATRLKEIADVFCVSLTSLHAFADTIAHIDFKNMGISHMLSLFESRNSAEKENFTSEELHIIFSYIKVYFENKANSRL